MGFKLYRTGDNKIVFKYPETWENIIEEDGSHLFYDEQVGSFRFTPILIKNDNFNLKSFLTKEFNDNSNYNPEWRLFNDREFVYYEQLSNDVADNSKLHYYISGHKNTLLICSYAYDRSLIDNKVIKNELDNIEHLFHTLRFN